MPPSDEGGLSWRILTRIDTKLRSELDQEKGEWLVKVPASPALRAVWKRYCDSVGIPMGHGLVVLLHHELASIVDEDVETLADCLQAREAEMETQARELKDREKGLKQRDRVLFLREADLEDREKEVAAREQNVAMLERNLAQRVRQPVDPGASATARPKLGRNDLCWCDSGKKYKYCHLPRWLANDCIAANALLCCVGLWPRHRSLRFPSGRNPLPRADWSAYCRPRS
jgi:hypothetical protein